MRNVFTSIHAGLVRVMLVAIGLQFFAAGLGIFGAAGFQLHQILGRAIMIIALLILIAALVARPGVMRIGLSATLLALTVLQFILARSPAIVAALHPVNALVIVFVTLRLIQQETMPGLWPRRNRSVATSTSAR